MEPHTDPVAEDSRFVGKDQDTGPVVVDTPAVGIPALGIPVVGIPAGKALADRRSERPAGGIRNLFLSPQQDSLEEGQP